MGLLVDGKWVDQWYETESNQGEFKRQESLFRHWITADGSPGPTGSGGFEAAAGRYLTGHRITEADGVSTFR